MSELNGLILNIAGVFAASMLISYLIVKRKRRTRVPVPKVNAILRVSTSGCVYRAHFIGVRPEGWVFTPPIQRDAYIPMRVGEYITMETVTERGIAIYRTTVREISRVPHAITVDKPGLWNVDDRRESSRIEQIGHLTAKLDGNNVGLVDMSACGARIRSQAKRNTGDRVKLEVAGFDEPIYGWVLDTDRRGDRYFLRLRFEEETDLSTLVGA